MLCTVWKTVYQLRRTSTTEQLPPEALSTFNPKDFKLQSTMRSYLQRDVNITHSVDFETLLTNKGKCNSLAELVFGLAQ